MPDTDLKARPIGDDSEWKKYRLTQRIMMGYYSDDDDLYVDASLKGLDDKQAVRDRVINRTETKPDDFNIQGKNQNRLRSLHNFVSADCGEILLSRELQQNPIKINGIGVLESEYFYEKPSIEGESSWHGRNVNWVVDFGDEINEGLEFSKEILDDHDLSVTQDTFGTQSVEWDNWKTAIKEEFPREIDLGRVEEIAENEDGTDSIYTYQEEIKKEKVTEEIVGRLQEKFNEENLKKEDLAKELTREKGVLNNLIEHNLFIWGAQGGESEYGDLRPHDWVACSPKEGDDDEVAFVKTDIVLNELPEEDREKISGSIFDDDDFTGLWISKEEPKKSEVSWEDIEVDTSIEKGLNKLNQDKGAEKIMSELGIHTQPEPSEYYKELRDKTDRPEIARQALTHLIAGKNVLFYGPPGSGKTRLAESLMDIFTPEPRIETAHSEWTQYEVVGGPKLTGDNEFEPQRGYIPEAARECENTLRNQGVPSWLLIDEINRANLDQAFGAVFTQLDLDYRNEPIEIGQGDESIEQKVPLAFRLLATMNTSDQAQLFALGYAFRRRFAFVEVPSLIEPNDDEENGESDNSGKPSDEYIEDVTKLFGDENGDQSGKLEKDALELGLDATSDIENDTPLCLPSLDIHEVEDYENEMGAIIHLVRKANEIDGLEIGQGLVIDATRYVVVHKSVPGLGDGKSEWRAVDEAVASYILPQFDAVMPDLRKEEVAGSVGDEDTLKDDLGEVVDELSDMGLTQSKKVLEEAIEKKRVI